MPNLAAKSSHLEGAAALLEARGVDRGNCLLGNKGLNLFLHFRSQLVIIQRLCFRWRSDTEQLTNSLQRNAPVADAVFRLSNVVKDLMLPDQLITTELWDTIERLANFRATKESFSSDSSLAILLQLDSDLEKWSLSVPLAWRYKIHTNPAQDNIYTSCYHIYPGFSVATTWNQYRVARCLVNELLLERLDSPHPERIKETTRNICNEICASVPYFFRRTLRSDTQNPGIGAMDIMWSLFVCGSMHCLPDTQRLWAIKQLENIGRRMWINQALTWANLAKSKITLAKCGDLRGLDTLPNAGYDSVF
jgi:hypothetical protein